ncbi:MAG: hypothetical protein OXG35_34305 [Acidobacteria bacterium]|nr:hypothetical protein [Acidobacteriota bacterium]
MADKLFDGGHCEAVSPGGFLCTLEDNHADRTHVAKDDDGNVIEAWPPPYRPCCETLRVEIDDEDRTLTLRCPACGKTRAQATDGETIRVSTLTDASVLTAPTPLEPDPALAYRGLVVPSSSRPSPRGSKPRCGSGNKALKPPWRQCLPCILEKGHGGDCEDATGCHWNGGGSAR